MQSWGPWRSAYLGAAQELRNGTNTDDATRSNGNPPEYNKSVRDFDIVTLDRVRRMDIEPDLPVWMLLVGIIVRASLS